MDISQRNDGQWNVWRKRKPAEDESMAWEIVAVCKTREEAQQVAGWGRKKAA